MARREKLDRLYDVLLKDFINICEKYSLLNPLEYEENDYYLEAIYIFDEKFTKKDWSFPKKVIILGKLIKMAKEYMESNYPYTSFVSNLMNYAEEIRKSLPRVVDKNYALRIAEKVGITKDKYDDKEYVKKNALEIEKLSEKELKDSILKCEESFERMNILYQDDLTRTKIIKQFNVGMYSQSQKEIVQELREHGIKVGNDSLHETADLKILQYRLAGLRLVTQLCDDVFLKHEYEGLELYPIRELLLDTRSIGRAVYFEFLNKYGYHAKDCLIAPYIHKTQYENDIKYEGQERIKEVFPLEEKFIKYVKNFEIRNPVPLRYDRKRYEENLRKK